MSRRPMHSLKGAISVGGFLVACAVIAFFVFVGGR